MPDRCCYVYALGRLMRGKGHDDTVCGRIGSCQKGLRCLPVQAQLCSTGVPPQQLVSPSSRAVSSSAA